MLCLPVCFKALTRGFRLSKLTIDMPFHPEWEVKEAVAGIEAILEQPYRFLGKGAQMYVFASHDGNYVVKLFRYDQPLNPVRALLRRKKKDPATNARKMLDAAKLAFNEAREETGLVYIHLNPTEGELPRFFCTDPLRRRRTLPLDHYRFVVQKRVTPFREALLKAMEEDPQEVQNKIDAFLTLLLSRTAKGIYNSDPNLSRNFGFLGDRAIELDFGNYSKRCFDSRKEMEKYTARLRRWLKKKGPEWVSYLDARVEERYLRNQSPASSAT